MAEKIVLSKVTTLLVINVLILLIVCHFISIEYVSTSAKKNFFFYEISLTTKWKCFYASNNAHTEKIIQLQTKWVSKETCGAFIFVYYLFYVYISQKPMRFGSFRRYTVGSRHLLSHKKKKTIAFNSEKVWQKHTYPQLTVEIHRALKCIKRMGLQPAAMIATHIEYDFHTQI